MPGLTTCLLLGAAALAQGDTVLATAETLIEAQRLDEARTILDEFVRENPENPEALILLGRVHLDWPTVGRFRALELFRRAAELDPGNPEPLRWQIATGLYLGSSDGERIVREALYGLWDIDPGYPGSWEVWRSIHRGEDKAREAAAVLARHRGSPIADLRRAQLLIEAGDYAMAGELLQVLMRNGRNDAAVWALQAEALLLSGDTLRGLDSYRLAIRRSASDSLAILWDQVASIASPEEEAIYDTLSTDLREAFYRAFWERREPDLTRRGNERVVEHFERLARARHQYRIRHPLAMFHRSRAWRTVVSEHAGTVAGELSRSNFGSSPLERSSSAQDRINNTGPSVDVRDLPEPDSVSRYRKLGFDGRGLVYLRFGEPEQRYVSAGRQLGGDVETWLYRIDGEQVAITFARAGNYGSMGGDMIVYPTNRVQLHNSAVMLEHDESSLKTDVELAAWAAVFRSTSGLGSQIYVRAGRNPVTARVWDLGWRPLETVTGSGVIVLPGQPGLNRLGIDHRDGDDFASLRSEVTVPAFPAEQLSLSSILVGAGEPASFDRDGVASAMPADLEFDASESLALYAEIYELAPEADGSVRYQVEYSFHPVDGGDVVTFEFDRRRPASRSVSETLQIQPGQIDRGVYTIELRVRDLVRRREVSVTRIDVRLD